MPGSPLFFNGIDGSTGDYLSPHLTVEQLAMAVARGRTEPELAQTLQLKERSLEDAWTLPFGVDPQDLAQAGWAAVFAKDEADELLACLEPLLAHRRAQAGARFKSFTRDRGVLPGDTPLRWLGRNGAGPGQPQVSRVPYYLLLVGDPSRIPFRFQFELALNYAVGRLSLRTLDEYRNYVRKVLESESASGQDPADACFFGVRNADDKATHLSADDLIVPLAEAMATRLQSNGSGRAECMVGEQATKAALKARLHDGTAPALLVTASHGLRFPKGHPRQAREQGAFVCQDWPGPDRHKAAIPAEFCFAATDIDESAALPAISFHYGCYSAGTPLLDDFAHATGVRVELAEAPFVAQLPQRMLGHPHGSLAVVGHVERTWTFSFHWPGLGPQIESFDNCLGALVAGLRVGSAMEPFAQRYAQLSGTLAGLAEDIASRAYVDAQQLAGYWTANNDAKNYVVLGDPAVRLPRARCAAPPAASGA